MPKNNKLVTIHYMSITGELLAGRYLHWKEVKPYLWSNIPTNTHHVLIFDTPRLVGIVNGEYVDRKAFVPERFNYKSKKKWKKHVQIERAAKELIKEQNNDRRNI